jgi:hypothetical protein
MKRVTFIIGPNEQIEFKTDREDFINGLKLSFKNKQLFEINLGEEIVLINLDKILFAKIKEVTD